MVIKRHRFFLFAAFVLIGILVGFKIQIAHAEPLTVTKTDDTNDGHCDADCSLREAVIEANLHPGTVISIPPGTYTLTIAGSGENAAATGDLDITTNMTISGSRGAAETIISVGSSVPGGLIMDDFIFHVIGPVGMPATLTLSGVTLRHSQSAAILVTPTGNLDLSNSIVTDNVGNYGSSILIRGTATLSNVSVSNNTVSGGINNLGILTLSNSTLSGNSAVNGGGLFNTGTATLTNVTISGNQAVYRGGGIYNTGTLTLLNDTISGNISNSETPSVVGGGGIRTTSPVTMKNTILSGNVDMSNQGPDCFGTLTSQGHNLVQDTTHCTGIVPSDLAGSNPQLVTLASNGGPTFTQAIPVASPAVRAGDATGCPTTDQRGMSRAGGCDIGAYQFQAVCGDGTLTLPEQCDHGTSNSDTVPNACRTTCQNPRCGDGVIDTGEECDGGSNCNSSCRLTSTAGTGGTSGTGGTGGAPAGTGGSGGTVGTGGATGTGGASGSSGSSGTGGSAGTGGTGISTVAIVCGNGIVEASEQCDDGNQTNGDGCSATCTNEPLPGASVSPDSGGGCSLVIDTK